MIVVDTNIAENFLYDACKELNFPVERQRLDVGDVVFRMDDLTYVIERKTWQDLGASICDGRWFEQKSRMTKEENVQYAYLIEGDLLPWEPTPGSRMNPNSLWGALLKTQIRDGFHVFHTKDKTATAKMVCYLYKQFSNNGFCAKDMSNIVTGISSNGALKRKRDNLDEPSKLLAAMLTIVPGMSKKKADHVVKFYPTLTLLHNASENDIAELKVDDRKIGPVIAKRIKSL